MIGDIVMDFHFHRFSSECGPVFRSPGQFCFIRFQSLHGSWPIYTFVVLVSIELNFTRPPFPRWLFLFSYLYNQNIIMELKSFYPTHVANMVVEGDPISKAITVHMRIPGRAAGQLFAVITHHKSAYTKPFAFDPANEVHQIDFSDVLPDGFFIPGRQFRIDFREFLNLEPLSVQWIAEHRAATVHCVDDANDGVQPQTIGIEF